MDSPKVFKVLYGYGSGIRLDKNNANLSIAQFIPWEVAETFREQAYKNHSQTLERLNERGGLSPLEMYCCAKSIRWPNKPTFEDHRAANLWLWTNAVEKED